VRLRGDLRRGEVDRVAGAGLGLELVGRPDRGGRGRPARSPLA
jgi:hypothetical protein